jgi:hypothetical protein
MKPTRKRFFASSLSSHRCAQSVALARVGEAEEATEAKEGEGDGAKPLAKALGPTREPKKKEAEAGRLLRLRQRRRRPASRRRYQGANTKEPPHTSVDEAKTS